MATMAPVELTEYDRALFRPSRTNYPGSRFGPKTRYDLPQRRKAYGNADEAENILFSGTSLQPLALPPPGTATSAGSLGSTPRTLGALGDAARSILHPLSDRNLPELPLIDEKNDVHGVLTIGGKGSGKTSLILSFTAAQEDAYPKGAEVSEKKRSMPSYGQTYEFPEREVKMGNGDLKEMRLVFTDTPACGTHPQEEQPLCATVSPNSTQHYNAIPSWMRITLRSNNFPHYAVLVVVDAMATPLWEDARRCRDLARLCAVLKKSQYTVVVAVTKLLKLRETAMRDVAHGAVHGGQVGKDPRSSYETFVGRYLDKVCASIQAKAGENDWSFSPNTDSPPWPVVNSTIFDAPSWVSVNDFKEWEDKRGTSTLPNFKYMTSQLSRVMTALCQRSHM